MSSPAEPTMFGNLAADERTAGPVPFQLESRVHALRQVKVASDRNECISASLYLLTASLDGMWKRFGVSHVSLKW